MTTRRSSRGTPIDKTRLAPAGKGHVQPEITVQLAKQTFQRAMLLLAIYIREHHKDANWAIMATSYCRFVFFGARQPMVIASDREIITQYIQKACELTGYKLAEPKKSKKRKKN